MNTNFKLSKVNQYYLQISGLEYKENQYYNETNILKAQFSFEDTITLNILQSINSKEEETIEFNQFVEHSDDDSLKDSSSVVKIEKDGLYKITHAVLPILRDDSEEANQVYDGYFQCQDSNDTYILKFESDIQNEETIPHFYINNVEYQIENIEYVQEHIEEWIKDDNCSLIIQRNDIQDIESEQDSAPITSSLIFNDLNQSEYSSQLIFNEITSEGEIEIYNNSNTTFYLDYVYLNIYNDNNEQVYQDDGPYSLSNIKAQLNAGEYLTLKMGTTILGEGIDFANLQDKFTVVLLDDQGKLIDSLTYDGSYDSVPSCSRKNDGTWIITDETLGEENYFDDQDYNINKTVYIVDSYDNDDEELTSLIFDIQQLYITDIPLLKSNIKLFQELSKNTGKKYFAFYNGEISIIDKESINIIEPCDFLEYSNANVDDYVAYKSEQYTFFMQYLMDCYYRIASRLLQELCPKSCNKGSELVFNRDLVWMAINVINYLIETFQYYEAQRYLEIIEDCGGVCNNKRQERLGCGCRS